MTWLSLNSNTPQKRAIAYAVYSKLLLIAPREACTNGDKSRLLKSRWYLWKSSLQRSKYPRGNHLINIRRKRTNVPFQSDAPLYRKAWVACLALAAVWLTMLVVQTGLFTWYNRRFANRVRMEPEQESKALYVNRKGRKYRYYI